MSLGPRLANNLLGLCTPQGYTSCILHILYPVYVVYGNAKKKTATSTMINKGPFDIIVITSPDHESSLAVRELIISSCGANFVKHKDDEEECCTLQSDCGVIYVSTCDPYGVRMGR